MEGKKKKIMTNYRDSYDNTVYSGEIESVVEFGVFVTFGNGRLGFLHCSKIPGFKDSLSIPSLCKKGDKIKIRVDQIHKILSHHISLDCAEYPVKE